MSDSNQSTTTAGRHRSGLPVHIARFAVAVILLQTLFFKFAAAPESVWIFTQLGAEPWGRIGTGVIELVAAVLLIWPRRAVAAAGAVLALGVIAGAIGSHLLVLGIEVQDDGGTLFVLALLVALGAAIVLGAWRRELLQMLRGRSASTVQPRS